MRSSKHQSVTAVIILMIGFSACVGNPRATGIEDTTKALAAAAIERAVASSNETEGVYDFISASAEIAIALDSMGRHDEAWQLITEAIARLPTIPSQKSRHNGMGDIALALKQLRRDDRGVAAGVSLMATIALVDDIDKQTDLAGKLQAALTIHGDPDKSLTAAMSLPKATPAQAAYRDRTLREIAAHFATLGDGEKTQKATKAIDGAFTYYAGVARTDIVAAAITHGHDIDIEALLAAAELLADSQENSYFAAGIFRDSAHAQFLNQNPEGASRYVELARAAARRAPTAQEKARSMSRIATRLSDIEQYQETERIIKEALLLLNDETSPVMRSYSLYEIAGSAAFSGHFNIAQDLIGDIPETPFGSAASLRSATQRDIAFGFAKHGQVTKALAYAENITTARERSIAFSRIARLIVDPSMDAVARYL